MQEVALFTLAVFQIAFFRRLVNCRAKRNLLEEQGRELNTASMAPTKGYQHTVLVGDHSQMTCTFKYNSLAFLYKPSNGNNFYYSGTRST